MFGLRSDKEQLIAGISVNFARLQCIDALVAIFHRNHSDLEVMCTILFIYGRLVGSASDDSNLFSGHVGEGVKIRRPRHHDTGGSTNVMFEKSTSFMRPRVMVLEPHSMSAWPSEIAEKRVCTVTGTHSILMSDTPNCCPIDCVTS